MKMSMSPPARVSEPIEVLVAEDDREVSLLWQRILEAAKFKTVPAGSTSLALRVLREEEPDCMLLDLRLNGNSGATSDVVIDEWISSRRGPVCVISGFLDDKASFGLYERGVDHVLQKPVPPGVVRAIFSSYSDRIELKRTVSYIDGVVDWQRQIIKWLAGSFLAAVALLVGVNPSVLDALHGIVTWLGVVV